MGDGTSAKARALLSPEPQCDPLRVLLHPVQSISSLLPPSSLLPGLLTVQVAAWAGHLPTPASSDRQDQQAKEQRSGGRHGHLKQWADRCR